MEEDVDLSIQGETAVIISNLEDKRFDCEEGSDDKTELQQLECKLEHMDIEDEEIKALFQKKVNDLTRNYDSMVFEKEEKLAATLAELEKLTSKLSEANNKETVLNSMIEKLKEDLKFIRDENINLKEATRLKIIEFENHYEGKLKLKDEELADLQALLKNAVESKEVCVNCKELQGNYEKISICKEKADKEHVEVAARYEDAINEKDSLIATQMKLINEYRDSVEGKRFHFKRNGDEIIKAKRKKGGSSKNIVINKCEYPSCESVDIDLIKCCVCSTYVCEDCNDVPVSKLKSIVNKHKSIYFLCKTCSCESNDGDNKSIDDDSCSTSKEDTGRLQEELKDKEGVIRSMETAQNTLNELLTDKDEIIENQKMIIGGLQRDKDQEQQLKEARNIIALKEAEISSCRDKLKQFEETTNESNMEVKLHAVIEENEALVKNRTSILCTRKTNTF